MTWGEWWVWFAPGWCALWCAAVLLALPGTLIAVQGRTLQAVTLPQAALAGAAVGLWWGMERAWLPLPAGVAALALAMMPGRTAPPVVLVGGSVAPILLLAHHPHGLAVAESLALSRMLGLTWEAVVGPALLLVVVVVLTGWDHRRVKAVVLDPAWAASQGIPVTAIQVGVGAIAGLAVAVCLPVVGVIGISGFLLLPPLAATSLAPALGTRLWVAPVVATGAVLGALPVSHGMDWPPIPTTMGILVLLVLLVPWVTRGFRSERHR